MCLGGYLDVKWPVGFVLKANSIVVFGYILISKQLYWDLFKIK